MADFTVPTHGDVSPRNRAIFEQLEHSLGFVPNLYALYAHSETALGDYLALQNRTSSLRALEREAINLVVSQVNGCRYCQSAHTVLGSLNGLTDEQIVDIRSGSAAFDPKLDALVALAGAVAETRGRPDSALLDAFFDAGYTKEQLIDVLIVIGDKTISNYLHNITQIPIDFPLAPALEPTAA